MSGDRGSRDILAEENTADREKLVGMLEKAGVLITSPR